MQKKKPDAEISRKLERLALLEKKLELQQGLPHLYGQKFYSWAREFFESTEKDNFLCAANQIGKSSIQIRKAIHWATAKDLWPKLWHTPPVQLWYLYPTRDLCNIEIVTKWEREFLPRGKYKEDPVYGWHFEKDSKDYKAIHFNSGCSIYFKAYSQNPQALQAGTVHAIFTDEELPEHLYDELNLRRAATDGYFHMVFTATLGQELWRRTIEEIGTSKEKFPDSFKRQVSMYDCLTYDDGTSSHWTKDRIKRIERSCKSQAEVDRRVYGRFVKDEGLKYPCFDRSVNVVDKSEIPSSWLTYAGIDVGGGGTSHPSAISILRVSPDFSKGIVCRGWRGDGVVTTASDVLSKYQELTSGLQVVAAYFDFSAKDFGTIAARSGVTVTPAEKSHAIGEQTLNVLFKNKMLVIEDRVELEPLVSELCTLSTDTKKSHATDDFIDSLRYATSKINWNWSHLASTTISEKRKISDEEMFRRGLLGDENGSELLIEEEFEWWNELYEP
jgi:phage terminase large subunit-like protein